MAVIYLKREKQKLAPADQFSLDIIMKFKEEEVIECPIKKKRNYQFHKKLFALFNLAWENSYMNMPFDKFRTYATARSGHGEIIDGVLIADSLAFDKMDELEFEKVYNDVLQFVMIHLNITKETIEAELINFL